MTLLQSTLDMSNTDISKYNPVSNKTFLTNLVQTLYSITHSPISDSDVKVMELVRIGFFLLKTHIYLSI